MRLFLSKFASEGNSVLALIDEGCGKEEDLVAMISIANGIIRMEIKEGSRIINVVKHPRVAPTRIEVTIELKRIELESRASGIGLTREVSSYAIESEVETHVSYGPKLIPQEILSAGERPLYETRPLLWPRLIGPIMLTILGIVIYVVAEQFKLGLEVDFGQMLVESMLMILGWVGITIFPS